MRKEPVIIILCCLLIGSLAGNYIQYRDAMEKDTTVTIDTVVRWKDRVVSGPIHESETFLRKDTKKVKIHAQKMPENIRDTVIHIIRDTVTGGYAAEMPVTQKVYADSSYTAYVSGYLPRLDSLRLRYPVVTATVTRTKKRRLHIGIVGGYGYGFKNRDMELFVGLGLTYELR